MSPLVVCSLARSGDCFSDKNIGRGLAGTYGDGHGGGSSGVGQREGLRVQMRRSSRGEGGDGKALQPRRG